MVNRTILLADDEPSVRVLVTKILQMAGYSVIAVEDGQAAAEHLDQHTEHIDILISDIVMPGVSGIELAEKMEKMCPQTKILLMSGFIPEGTPFHESWSFLRKPFSPMVLTERVERLLKAA